MFKVHRTIVALLTVCSVLLALNLIAMTSPVADGAPANATGPSTVPYIVKLLPRSGHQYVRVWSDGRADTIQWPSAACDFELLSALGPVEHPFPVVDAVFGSNHDTFAVMMTFEDGRVDLIGDGPLLRCTIAGVGTPSLCIGDVDRDGTVGIEDLLIVLSQWGGPCQ